MSESGHRISQHYGSAGLENRVVATLLSRLTGLERATDFGQPMRRRCHSRPVRVLKPGGRFVFQDIMSGLGAARHAAAGLAPSVLGIHVVMGEQYALMQSNQVRNLEERRVSFVRGAMSKPTIA